MSERIEKVNSLLKREISKLLQKEIAFPEGALVTVSRVEATANLIEAKVYISVFPEQKAEEVLVVLKKEVYDIQQEINRKLNMRPIPKIIFVNDSMYQKAGKVEEILGQLKKEEK